VADGTAWSQCSVELPDGGRCRTAALKGAPFPICSAHLREAFRFCHTQLDVAVADGADVSAILARQNQQDANWRFWTDRVARGKPRSVVYYIQVGERIKVGTTVNLTARKAAYPPGSEVLATELGSYDLESERHRQFAAYLVAGREWFHPGPKLLAHIASLQAQAA
jgi:hypothetical protein